MTENTGAKFKPIPEGTPPEEVVRLYDEWTTYEQEVVADNYIGPAETAKVTATFFPEETRGDVRLLDIGAGTGLVGMQARKLGFRHIDALEPSTVMLQQARERGIYENYITEILTPDGPTSIPPDTYDAVLSSGAVGGVHIPVTALREVVRILKPGGMVVIVVRDSGQNLDLVDVAADLQTRGKLIVLESRRMPFLHNGYKGIAYVYKKSQ